MASNPSDRWFWNDWDNDIGLRSCSLTAQGLWMRMLSICARSKPRGYLVIGETQCAIADLARIVGEPPEVVSKLVDELERFGVFSRTRHGTIYNRKMVSNEKLSKINAKKGKKGGDVTYGKQTGIFARPSDRSDIGSDPYSSSSYLQESLGNTEPKSEELSLNVSVGQRGTTALTQTHANGHDPEASFEKWWQAYPRKVGRKACKSKYLGVLRRREATAEQMLAALQTYIDTKPVNRDWCHPLTWLNQGRWADGPVDGESDYGDSDIDGRTRSMRTLANQGWSIERIAAHWSCEIAAVQAAIEGMEKQA